MRLFIFSLAAIAIMLMSCTKEKVRKSDDIVIENEQFKLVVGSNAITKSLLFKPTGEECLMKGEDIALFSVTQERPYNNELKLAHPNKKTTFQADTLYWKDGKLIVGFEIIPYKAMIDVKVTPHYVRFSLADFIFNATDFNVNITPPPATEMRFLQLPVKNRKYFGEWLNVSWDDRLAINVLGTDPYPRIDAEKCKGYRILTADAVKDIKFRGTGAALIVCAPDSLLDHIDAVEEDFNLPRGAKNRRDKMNNASYFFTFNMNPQNVDQYLKYVKMGGFRCMSLYYPCFIEGGGYDLLGNYDWQRALYPNGKDDLKKMLDKIKDEGVAPGFHFLHSHIGVNSRYVTPEADYRLNLRQRFNLSKPLGKEDTTVFVEQNPEGVTMAAARRILKVGTELISYTSYTTEPPYQFRGCQRGVHRTTVLSHPQGLIIGILDVSEHGGGTSVYINQATSLQDEVAEKIADIYNLGFEFVYFDGSEGVNPPFGSNVPLAQYKVYKRLKPEPLFAEGAAKAHFSWHMLSGGNAFDVFAPEVLKERVREFPAEEAPRMRMDFTRINFGWLGYWVPNKNTVGTQPDMLEYVTSRAAAWDCPVAIQMDLGGLEAHPRNLDNMEVFRRWEEVRAQNWLTKEQKLMLRNLKQEHILLLNEKKEFELVPYTQIDSVANGSRDVRAFIFERNKELYVVYWHISGSANLELPLNSKNVKLLEELGKKIPLQAEGDHSITIPVSNRRYLKTNGLTKKQLITTFKKAKIIE